MKKTASILAAAAVVLTTFGATAIPANAAPYQTLQMTGASNAELVNAQYRGRDNDRRGDRNRFERRGNDYYFNGYRGNRDRRPGYREYNGYWFPPAAFIFGAIIGGAIANQNRGGVSLSNAHIEWCNDRYRSYRSSDNTFQPYNGPRQQCVSPYSR